MAEVRYYADEHVSRATVGGLRHRGIDVLTATEMLVNAEIIRNPPTITA